MKPFKLKASLFAHTSDVKMIAPVRDLGGFASVSRDMETKVWCRDESNHYVLKETLTTHKKYVNSVTVTYSLPEFPNGLLITGSTDKTISIIDIETGKTLTQLEQHEGAVCTLHANEIDNLLYSGSFDYSARVWNLNSLIQSNFKSCSSFVLKGHTLTVWCVIGVDKQGIILTASADKSIKHWQLSPDQSSAEEILTYTGGHTDCVRGLALNVNNKQEFFSCANDGNVVHWRLGQPNPLRTIHVADSFLYSINMIKMTTGYGDCQFVTSSEDRSIRVHQSSVKSLDISTLQTISLPCQTVWYACCLSNGDLIAACSDGSIRIFTQDESQFAGKQQQEEFERELAQFSIPVRSNEALSQINRSELPGIEALARPSKMDGQPLMINNNNEVEVYQWSDAESRWIKIGTAVGSADGAGGGNTKQKITYLGREYDYVFDIELDDTGSQKLKLPYNLTENPYMAAQEFIHKHELSQMFLDQIAQFIITNTQGEMIGTGSTSVAYDPFTGENRYVPGMGTTTSARPSSNGSHSNGKRDYVDPFTGTGAYYSKGQVSQQQPATNEYYPCLNFIAFEQINLDPLFKKLREIQHQISVDVKIDLVNNRSNIEQLESLMSGYKDSTNEIKDHIDLLFQMIDVWPKQHVFPLLDLARVIVLNKNVTDYLFRDQSTSYLSTKTPQASNNYYFNILGSLADGNPTNTMCVLRVFFNLFKSLQDLNSASAANNKLLAFILNERSFLFTRLNELFAQLEANKSCQIAFASVLLNYVILYKKLARSCGDLFSGTYVTDQLFELVGYINEPQLTSSILNWDSEAVFRILVSFGTMISNTDQAIDYEYLISVTKSLENFYSACKQIAARKDKFAEKVVNCAQCLISIS